MTFDELITKVRTIASKTDVSDHDFLAVQINISGKESGVFYVEVKDHKISVEPYDYHDRNCAITISLTDFNKLIDGKLDRANGFVDMGRRFTDGGEGSGGRQPMRRGQSRAQRDHYGG